MENKCSYKDPLERNLRWAVYWFHFGLRVIPCRPGTKATVVKWDPWLEDLSEGKIIRHWRVHPSHDIGFVVGDGLIILDADSPASLAALEQLERRLEVTPRMIVETRRGVHHYFRRAASSFARAGSYKTDQFPERLDVKTGKSLVLLPPSGPRKLVTQPLRSIAELSELGKAAIDLVSAHNQQSARAVGGAAATGAGASGACGENGAEIRALLNVLDADLDYDDWLHVLMAVHHEFGGSDEGLQVANEWSARGIKYKGLREIRAKWRSFDPDPPRPFTIATIRYLLSQSGHDWMAIASKAIDPDFGIVN